MKCRRKTALDVHHIVWADDGGLDLPENLITLCKECHKAAPDSPAEFFRWAVTGLPPNLDESIMFARMCVYFVCHKNSLSAERTKEAVDFVNEIFCDLWKTRHAMEGAETTLSFKEFGGFVGKYFPDDSSRQSSQEPGEVKRSTKDAG